MIPDFHARRFDRAASTYAAHASVQAGMAADLIRLAPELPGPGPAVIEFGCGTGLFTRALRARFPAAGLVATDASPRMLEAARAASSGDAALRFLAADASGATPLPAGAAAPGAGYDLAASNALVQWFPDLAAHFALAASALRPGGHYLASGFDPDNFPELNAILREPPFGFTDFPGHGQDDIEAAAEEAGLTVEVLVEGERTEAYTSARAFLAAIQSMGSARRPGTALTRARLAALIGTYQARYGSADGVRATWKPWFARLRKPG